MNKIALISVLALVITVLVVPDLDARGGGRGGGGGGRGGGMGRSVQRSPSMSRSLPNRPTSRVVSPQERGANRQVSPQRIEPRRTSITPQDERRQVPRPDQNAPRPGNRNPGGFQNAVQNRPVQGVITTPVQRQNVANNVRNSVRTNRPNRGNWFKHNDWWKYASATGIGAWLGWNSSPVYYDYYANNGAYYWGTPAVASAPVVYVDQAQVIDASTAQASGSEWMPLGVFAVAKDANSVAAPNMYLQLALNKEGAISGTFYNSTTDQGYVVEGTVDPNTQMASMKVAENPNSPILETGIYNLSQPEASAQLYYSDGRTANRLLVRLDEQ